MWNNFYSFKFFTIPRQTVLISFKRYFALLQSLSTEAIIHRLCHDLTKPDKCGRRAREKFSISVKSNIQCDNRGEGNERQCYTIINFPIIFASKDGTINKSCCYWKKTESERQKERDTAQLLPKLFSIHNTIILPLYITQIAKPLNYLIFHFTALALKWINRFALLCFRACAAPKIQFSNFTPKKKPREILTNIIRRLSIRAQI